MNSYQTISLLCRELDNSIGQTLKLLEQGYKRHNDQRTKKQKETRISDTVLNQSSSKIQKFLFKQNSENMFLETNIRNLTK